MGLLVGDFAEVGDVVYHYQKQTHSIVASSRVAAPYKVRDIEWAAHGSVARDAGVVPYRRPGWLVELDGYRELDFPLDLNQIRGEEVHLRRMVDVLVSVYGRPIYFPFALSDLRPPRPAQAYMAKMPSIFVEHFDLPRGVS